MSQVGWSVSVPGQNLALKQGDYSAGVMVVVV